MTELAVSVEGLRKVFPVRGERLLQRARLVAVDDVSFDLERGSTLGLVGESGSGKSTVANLVAGLLPVTAGRVIVNGVDIATLRGRAAREHRRDVQVVFQDPYSSMAPTSTIYESIREPLVAHRIGDDPARRARVVELMQLVGLDPSMRHRYPAEMSGGQLQRAAIARSLALEPKLVVLDEPVSALDVSTKAEIINLLADLKQTLGLSYLMISHDLSTMRVLADRVAVMYLGKLVEEGPADYIYTDPRHPYTRALLASVPVPDPATQRGRPRIILPGDVPSPLAVPAGCSFHPRCPVAVPSCASTEPVPRRLGEVVVACHLAEPQEAAAVVGVSQQTSPRTSASDRPQGEP